MRIAGRHTGVCQREDRYGKEWKRTYGGTNENTREWGKVRPVWNREETTEKGKALDSIDNVRRKESEAKLEVK